MLKKIVMNEVWCADLKSDANFHPRSYEWKSDYIEITGARFGSKDPTIVKIRVADLARCYVDAKRQAENSVKTAQDVLDKFAI